MQRVIGYDTGSSGDNLRERIQQFDRRHGFLEKRPALLNYYVFFPRT